MKVTEEYAPTAGRIPLSLHFINARLNKTKTRKADWPSAFFFDEEAGVT